MCCLHNNEQHLRSQSVWFPEFTRQMKSPSSCLVWKWKVYYRLKPSFNTWSSVCRTIWHGCRRNEVYLEEVDSGCRKLPVERQFFRPLYSILSSSPQSPLLPDHWYDITHCLTLDCHSLKLLPQEMFPPMMHCSTPHNVTKWILSDSALSAVLLHWQ